MTGEPWQNLNIGQLGRVVTGSTPRTGDDAAWGDEIDFVTPTEMSYSDREPSKCRKLSASGMAALQRRVIPAGSTLFVCIGFSTGKVAQIFRPAITNQQVNALIPNPSVVNERFAYYLLRYKSADIRAIANGSTTPIVNKSMFQAVDVLLPSRREQEAIADVLGVLDDKSAVNERIATTYEQLLQCHFAELGLSDEPTPETAVSVTDFVSFNPKVPKPSADEPVYVDMAALQANRAGIPSWTRRPPKSGTRFMNGDTLLARITPCLENGKTGYVDFMEEGEIGLGSTEFIVMRSIPGVPKELSYFLARDSRFREHGIRNMVGTSGRQRFSAADAANYEVNRPDADALAAFGKKASAAFAHMKSLQSESSNLAALRDTLLPQLMSGRLRVKDAEKIVEDAT